MAKCCNPQPGDKITGIVVRGKGVSIHNINCPRIKYIPRKRRLKVQLQKISAEPGFAVNLDIIAKDRIGLFKDITATIANYGVNILSFDGSTSLPDDKVRIQLKIVIPNIDDLLGLMKSLESVPQIVQVKRR